MAADGFAAVLGVRRGAHDFGDLAAAVPGERAKQHAAALRQSAAEGDWVPSLDALARYTPQEVTGSPLLAELANRLARELATMGVAAGTREVRDWFAMLGIKTAMSEQVVMELSGRQLLHLWLEGVDHPLGLPRSWVTVCGRKLTPMKAARARRGVWLENASSGRQCTACAGHAPDYPEAHESAEYEVIWDAARQELRSRAASGPVLDGLLQAVHTGGPQTRESLQAAADTAVRDVLADWTAEVAYAHGEPVLQRAFGREVYGECRRLLPDRGREMRVSDYISPVGWRNLLRKYDVMLPTAQSRRDGAQKQAAVVAVKAALVARVKQELRHHLRFPSRPRPTRN